MFARAATFVLALPLLTLAGQCNTGEVQCCNSLKNASDDNVSGLLGLIGVAVQDITAQVGLDCSPISVIAAGGNSCTAQPVCCTDNKFNGLVAVGCTPVNANL
ncbi:hydrophobin-251 [Lyophyllum atratum]|nr:hydrophobin-251 [Lyophyllum atratum]